MEYAIDLARTNSLRYTITPGTFEDDLERWVKESDLIFETLAEDIALKRQSFHLIDKHRKPGSIVATGSSGLSVASLSEGMSQDFHKNFLCIHLYNPPTRLVAAELVPGPDTSKEVLSYVAQLMEKTFRRVVLQGSDVPAYAGNRIGLKVLNEVAQLVPQYGVPMLDYLFGGYTGRLLAPLATIDLIGWDVHKAVIDNIYQNTSDEAHEFFKAPAYMEDRIKKGFLGDKTPAKGGFYKKVGSEVMALNIKMGDYEPFRPPKIDIIEKAKQLIHEGDYREAFVNLFRSSEPEAAVVRRVISGYISYAGMRNGEVSDMNGINRVMGWGFNWIPPDALTDLLGIEETKLRLTREGMPIPQHLDAHKDGRLYREIDEVGRYLMVGR